MSIAMLERAVQVLDPFLDEVAFVGGATTCAVMTWRTSSISRTDGRRLSPRWPPRLPISGPTSPERSPRYSLSSVFVTSSTARSWGSAAPARAVAPVTRVASTTFCCRASVH